MDFFTFTMVVHNACMVGIIVALCELVVEMKKTRSFMGELVNREEPIIVEKKPINRNAHNSKHQSLSWRQAEAMTYKAGDEV